MDISLTFSSLFSFISMDAYEESVDRDVKSSSLKRRRDKLERLLAEETKAYQV